MRTFGISTGALAYGDFRRALEMLRRYDTNAVELSALRQPELGRKRQSKPSVRLMNLVMK